MKQSSSAMSSLANAMRTCELFSPRDGTTTGDTALEDRKRAIDEEIAAIIKNHELSCTNAELLSVLSIAADAFAHRFFSHEKQEGLGDKSSINALVTALTRASTLLNNAKLRKRLIKAIEDVPEAELPANPNQGIQYLFGERVFDSIPHSRAQISGLLSLAKHAATLDGRDDVAKRRDDLRAAAQPVLTYWTRWEKRSGSLYNRGGLFSPCVEFIYACLLLIDPSVKRQLIVELHR